jgi:hypothetical protein
MATCPFLLLRFPSYPISCDTLYKDLFQPMMERIRMKKTPLLMIIAFLITTVGTFFASAQEPPPPQTPYSSTYPDAIYEMSQEQIIGEFAVRLWKDPNADGFMFNSIATLQWNNEFGYGYLQVEEASGINALTGTDINGDGFMDVIIETYSGGAHCCSSAHVYTLTPNDPIKIYQHRPSNCGANFADVDADGIYEIITCDDSFAYAYCPYAASYAPNVALKYDPIAGYQPSQASFLAMIAFLGNERFTINTATASTAVGGAYGEWDGSTKCQVLPIVLDYLYSGQTDLAWQSFNMYYLQADASDFRAQIEAVVRGSSLFTPAIPPVTALQPPLILDNQIAVNGYTARVWKRASANAFIGEGVGILEQNGVVVAQFENTVSLGTYSGTDLNGNGTPDVVFETFTGGAHCCSMVIAYDLGVTPTLILQTRESNYSGRFEDINADGIYEFLTADDIFAYVYCPYVFSPSVSVILGYDGATGIYMAMSKFYPERYIERIAESTTVATTAGDGEFGEWDGTNKCSVLPVVLNYLYSGQYDMAWSEFYRLYRGEDAVTFREDVEATVNASMYYLP